MKEKITPYLKNGLQEPAIALQYKISDAETELLFNDPLLEDSHEVVKGLIHKYDNRVLIKVSYLCAAHCRFCTRIRQIGNPEGTLNENDFPPIIQYLTENPQIVEVILSGGDPFYTPSITFALLKELALLPQIKVFRIGTRLPLQLPEALKSPKYADLLAFIDTIGKQKPFFILLHINHPAELTEQAIEAIQFLRQFKTTILSQTVFLKGINDNTPILERLFTDLYHLGVIPYYIYHCDAVRGIEHFVVDLAIEQAIMTDLYTKLSGIACPKHVIDIEKGYGKLPVPQLFVKEEGMMDFKGNFFERKGVTELK